MQNETGSLKVLQVVKRAGKFRQSTPHQMAAIPFPQQIPLQISRGLLSMTNTVTALAFIYGAVAQEMAAEKSWVSKAAGNQITSPFRADGIAATLRSRCYLPTEAVQIGSLMSHCID